MGQTCSAGAGSSCHPQPRVCMHTHEHTCAPHHAPALSLCPSAKGSMDPPQGQVPATFSLLSPQCPLSLPPLPHIPQDAAHPLKPVPPRPRGPSTHLAPSTRTGRSSPGSRWRSWREVGHRRGHQGLGHSVCQPRGAQSVRMEWGYSYGRALTRSGWAPAPLSGVAIAVVLQSTLNCW